MDNDIDVSNGWDTSDFEGTESDNELDVLDSPHGPHMHPPVLVDEFSFDGSTIVTGRFGEEGPSFRLLKIAPGPFEGEVHCDLIKRPIYEAGLDYSALSYSWGRGSRSDAIYIGSFRLRFRVTDHLFQALRRLRNVSRPVYIWVDAICNNQADLGEKAAQIPLMAQIFNQAKEVVIWLGENVTPRPLSFLALSNRPNNWWTRLWILQETLYAASEPVVLLESCKISMSQLLDSWQPIFDTAFMDQATPPYWLRDLDAKGVRDARKAFDQMRQLRDAWVEQSTTGIVRKPLIVWIRLTAGRQCTQPVDRIYALLNIIPDKEADYFQPDYYKASKTLFDQVIHYHLFHTSWNLAALQQLVEDLHGRPAAPCAIYRWRTPMESSSKLMASLGEPKRTDDNNIWYCTYPLDEVSQIPRPDSFDQFSLSSMSSDWSGRQRGMKHGHRSASSKFRSQIAKMKHRLRIGKRMSRSLFQ